jgi:flagellar hook-length control protein FliK
LKWTELPGPNAGNNIVGAGHYGSEAAKINSSLKTTLAFEGTPNSETEKFDGLLLGDVRKSGTAETKPSLNQYPQVHSGYRKEPTWDQSNLTVQNSDSDRALHVQPSGTHVRMVPDGVSDLNKFDPISTADQNWSQKLVHQLHLNIINGRTNSINLQLHPASLGLLNLNVRKIGDKIEILITTQTKAAIKLLTDSQSKIAMLVAESGVKLDAIRVLDQSLQDNLFGSSEKDNSSSNDLNERNFNHDHNLESEDKIEQAEEIEMESSNNKIVIYA